MLAYQMSMENPFIQSEIWQANEFFELAKRYNVSGVPQILINDGDGEILGSMPGEYVLQEIKRVIGG